MSEKEQVTNRVVFTWKNEQNAAGPSDFCPLLGQLRKEEASQCKSGARLIFLGWSACLVDPKQIIPPPSWVHTRPQAELRALRFSNN